MIVVEKFTQRTPAWVDLQSRDQEASRASYTRLFGWQYQDVPIGGRQTYSMATLDGRPVAAIVP